MDPGCSRRWRLEIPVQLERKQLLDTRWLRTACKGQRGRIPVMTLTASRYTEDNLAARGNAFEFAVRHTSDIIVDMSSKSIYSWQQWSGYSRASLPPKLRTRCFYPHPQQHMSWDLAHRSIAHPASDSEGLSSW